MKHLLFTHSDNCLEFKSRAKAFIWASKNGINDFILLSKGYENGKVSVFNTFLIGDNQVEYLNSEHDALIYIGTFLQ